MNCSKIHKKILQYIDGELTGDENREVEKHLQNCTYCRNLYQKMKASWNNLQEEKIPYQPFYYTRLKQRMENEAERKTNRFKKLVLQPAIYVIVLGFGIYIGILLGTGLQPENPTVADADTTETQYIRSYAESQYWNGMELEEIEKEFLTEKQNIPQDE
jgi:predicted anti-sigma-YlaC factor YlaD